MAASKTRARWWRYVRRILCDYPDLLVEREKVREEVAAAALLCMKVTVDPERIPHPDPQAQWEMEAVDAAMEEADELTNRLIDLVFFRKTHTIEEAAMHLHIGYSSAKERQQAFIRSVAKHLGLMPSPAPLPLIFEDL